MTNNIIYNLPIWNGLRLTKTIPKIAKLEIGESNIKGIFEQKNIKQIKYNNDYMHMTPLSGSFYINYLRNKKNKLLSGLTKKTDNILEIGGGDSEVSNHIKFKSMTIVDPTLENSKNKKNIEIYADYFENIKLKKKFDVIILFSVIEHVDDINKFFKKISFYLKNNGKVFITTPIIDSQFLRGDFNSLLHEHTYYFTNHGLLNLFNKFNYQIIKYDIKNDCGYIILNKNQKYNNINFYPHYNIVFFKKIFEFQLIKFKKLLKENKSIIFYGATNGLNSLLHLSKKIISNNKIAITDGDKTKINKYLPSFNLKIVSKKNINKYLLFVISAQSFQEEILKENLNVKSTSFQ